MKSSPPRDVVAPDVARLLTALRRGIPDRVPNFEYLICKRNVSAILERPAPNSWGLSAADYVELVRRIGMDAIGGKLFLTRGQLLATVRARTLIDRSALAEYLRDGTIAPSTIDTRQIDEYFSAISNTRIGVWVHLSAGLTMIYDAIGYERFCLLLYDDPGFIEELFDRVVDDNLALIDKLLEYDFSFFHVGDDLGHKSGLLVSPQFLKDSWMPRIRRTVAPIHERGIPVTFHCDGNITEAIPFIIDLGFCSLNPIEPYGMDAYDIKSRFGDSLCLVGNVDVAGALAFGSPEEVEMDVRAHLAGLAPGGGYVCATSHSVIDDIPPENFMRMIETIHRYGRYRDDGSLLDP